MPVRKLALFDLPILHRYRHAVLALDSARTLTRGNPLGVIAMLSYLNPRRHIYTATCVAKSFYLIGQITYSDGEKLSRLSFLAPEENLGPATLELLDHLAEQAGSWGALHLLAEVDEHAQAFKSLRQAGYAIYAWQRVWKLSTAFTRPKKPTWLPARPRDLPAIQGLYSQIIPALLQPIEVLPRHPNGLTCQDGNELRAYADLTYGPTGIWVQPLIHPDAECVPEQLSALLHDVPNRAGRPVYLCVRSYQAWIEAMLTDLGASNSSRQALMVKHLGVLHRETQKLPVKAEKAWAKPATPVTRTDSS